MSTNFHFSGSFLPNGALSRNSDSKIYILSKFNNSFRLDMFIDCFTKMIPVHIYEVLKNRNICLITEMCMINIFESTSLKQRAKL